METAEYAGMFKWFEEATFPDPAGARETLRRVSLGLYPGAIKAAMAVFDVVESIAVSRTRVCAAGGIHALTRIQVSADALGSVQLSSYTAGLAPLLICECAPRRLAATIWGCSRTSGCLPRQRSVFSSVRQPY